MTILLVGPFPPPIYGGSIVTEKLAARLAELNLAVVKCNTSAHSMDRSLRYHLDRLRAYFRCWMTLARRPADDRTIVYLSVAGRWGQVYDLIAALIVRWRRLPIVFHHHNFEYIA